MRYAMAGKCKEMSKIKQVLRLYQGGMSKRAIGRELGLYKGTVNKYVNLAELDPLSLDELLRLDDPILEKRLTGGNPAYSDKRFDDLQGRLPYIAEELSNKNKTHVTRYLLWEEYKQDNPNGYEYTQFCFHVNQYLDAQKPSFVMRQDRPGGEYLHIDYAGDTLSYVDVESGEEIKCQVFAAVLPASDYPFFKAVPSQKVEDFLDGLQSALQFFGGVPKILVPDNLKAAVVKSDRYQPEVNTILEDFANHYGCVTLPARAYKPKDKANAEGSICRAYRRIYAPLRHQQFFSLEDLNEAIDGLQKLFVQKRMQQIPFTREERFIAIDKPNLKELPSEPFEIRIRTELKVQSNSHVYLGRDKSYYSVPCELIGKTVKVEYTPTLVAIYHNGQKVALHARSNTYGSYITVASHMPSYYEHYVNLSPEKYIERALAVSERLAEVVVNIFTSNKSVPPETYYKSCDGLFHLQKTTAPDIFDKACEIALRFNQCKYGYIKNLVLSKCSGFKSALEDPVIFPNDTHKNVRGPEYYKTH
jgi:transposase